MPYKVRHFILNVGHCESVFRHQSPASLLCSGVFHLEHYSETSILEACACDVETSNLLGGSYMLSDAGAHIVVAYPHEPQCLAGVLWKLVKLHALGYVVACDILIGHWQVFFYQFVHPAFYLLHLFGSGAGAQVEVDLAFLSFDVGVFGSAASEHSAHGLVEQVLRCVRRLVLRFVVLVEHWNLVCCICCHDMVAFNVVVSDVAINDVAMCCTWKMCCKVTIFYLKAVVFRALI